MAIQEVGVCAAHAPFFAAEPAKGKIGVPSNWREQYRGLKLNRADPQHGDSV